MEHGHARAGRPFELDDPALLFRPEVLADPAPLYEHLRTHAPVWELPGTSTFVVSTAALVAEAVARPDDFSSNLLSLLYRGEDGRPVVFDMTQLGPGIHVLATADPPAHTLHRKLLQPAFNPRAVEARADYIAALVEELVGTFVAGGGGEFATVIAEPLPVQVICKMIGIPDADVAALAPLVLLSNDILAGVADQEAMARSATAAGRVGAYLTDLLAQWRVGRHDPPVICDVLVEARTAGDLIDDDAIGMLVQLLGAGTETTTSLIARTVLHLAEDEALQHTVRARPELVPVALEEMLRYDGPFRFHYRSAVRDTELGDVRIPAGSRLLLMWASANLDEAAVDQPDRFDLARQNARAHFAFGRGMHFCIGAPLARLEGRIVVERLLRMTDRFALDGSSEVAYRPSIFLRRLGHLPLVVDRAGPADLVDLAG